MEKEILKTTELEMQEVIESFREYLLKIRTGRANPNMLNGVMVDSYGTLTPLNQTAQISSPEPQQLVVKPYDRNQVISIVGGINKADLGLNPIGEGDLVRITIPPLTEEIRKDLVKKMYKELESFKVRIRNIRRESNDQIKKESVSAEDVRKGYESDIQKLTDKFIAFLEAMSKEKETDLMKI